MFKIEANVLQEAVEQVVNGAKRARLAKGHIFINASNDLQEVKFYFVGENLQIEKKLPVKVNADFQISTTAHEFALKISALPKDVEVKFELIANNNVKVSWGRESSLTLLSTPETAPSIEVPEVVTDIRWGSGVLHYFARNFSGFCALENSTHAEKMPIITGVYFVKDDTEQLVAEATNAIRGIRSTFNYEWFEENFAIPAETLNSVAEVISPESEVSLGLNDKRTILVIKSGNTIALSRILSGSFPDLTKNYSDKNADILWRVDRLELLETTRRVKRLGGLKPILRTGNNGSKTYAVLDGVLSEQIGALIESDLKDNFSVNAENLEAALTVLRSEEIIIAFGKSQKGKSQALTIFSGDEDSAEKIAVMLAQVVDN